MFCISACLAAKISIHALRVEGDDAYHTATRCCRNFYPRPPGGGRPVSAGTEGIAPAISIHALRVEGDRRRFSGSIKDNPFLSTPSGWRATGDHAVLQRGSVDFYPRPPGGGRQQKRTKFSSVFAQKGEEFASLRRGKRKFAGGVLKRTNFGF